MDRPPLPELWPAASPPARRRRVSQVKRRSNLGFETALKIEEAIAQADLPVGTLIGTSEELARRYGVGRPSILVALRIVEFHGLARMRPGPGGGLVVAAPVLEIVAGLAGRHLMLSGALAISHVQDARAILAATAAQMATAGPLAAWIDAHPLGRIHHGKQECHAVTFPTALAAASGNLAAALFNMIASTAMANVAGPYTTWIVPHDLALWSRTVELQIVDLVRAGDAESAGRAAYQYARRLDPAGSPKYGPRPPDDAGSVIGRTRAGQVARSIIFSLGAQSGAGQEPGALLGTIDGLCRREGVCRATAVQALRMLEASGIVSVRAGRNQGYFQQLITPEAITRQILAFLRSRADSASAAREFAAAYIGHRASVGGASTSNPLLWIIDRVIEELCPA